MFLATNPTYLTVSQFKAMPNDYDLTSYSDASLLDILQRASGVADSIMRRSLLGQERTIRIYGDGSNRLELNVSPLLYVKKAQIVVPGTTGPLIPISQLLLDFTSGGLLEYTPMMWQGQGFLARFPDGAPVDVLVGHGHGGFTFLPPPVVLSDGSGSGITPGAYNVAVTTKTMWGETTATVKQYTTASGVLSAGITQTLGGYLYRAYVSKAANNTTLNGATILGSTSFVLASVGTIAVGDSLLFDSGANAEYLTVASVNSGTKTITTTSGAAYAHANGVAVIPQPVLVGESPLTTYGQSAFGITISSLAAPTGYWQDALPIVDSSAPVLPYAVQEAVRLLAMGQLYENNNLSNRGVYKTSSGGKSTMWRSTEGNSGKGVPLYYAQAMEWLKPYSLTRVF